MSNTEHTNKMKYFVCSDPHGFTSIMIKALTDAGFDRNNTEHKLIVCGDCWDRGNEPVEMYRYLKDLGDRFIFVRGNHEDLFFDAIKEYKECDYVYSYHHKHNGTDETIYTLNNEGLLDEVADWIQKKSINFYETEHYIFVHGWVPFDSVYNDEYDEEARITKTTMTFEVLENWREDNDFWKDARWYNGMEMWHKGIKIPGKTIVCGHYHCGYGNYYYHDEVSPKCSISDADYQKVYLSDHPFIDDGIIALDSCTVINKKVNVVVLED